MLRGWFELICVLWFRFWKPISFHLQSLFCSIILNRPEYAFIAQIFFMMKKYSSDLSAFLDSIKHSGAKEDGWEKKLLYRRWNFKCMEDKSGAIHWLKGHKSCGTYVIETFPYTWLDTIWSFCKLHMLIDRTCYLKIGMATW